MGRLNTPSHASYWGKSKITPSQQKLIWPGAWKHRWRDFRGFWRMPSESWLSEESPSVISTVFISTTLFQSSYCVLRLIAYVKMWARWHNCTDRSWLRKNVNFSDEEGITKCTYKKCFQVNGKAQTLSLKPQTWTFHAFVLQWVWTHWKVLKLSFALD